jgi:hypothetical protein
MLPTFRPVIAVLTLAAASALGCATSTPTLVPPAPRAEPDVPMWRCLREARSSLGANGAPLDAAAKAPLGGRETFGFLSWSSMDGPRPVVDSEERPSALGSSLFTVETQARRELADRYVLCLLSLGFRWQEGR